MSDLFKPRAGAIFSADIAANNQAELGTFYDKVLGTGDAPLWKPVGISSLGFPVLGIGSASNYPDMPPHWCIHIQVEDVGASVDRALARGGRMVIEGKDTEGVWQWAVLQDPAGALFGLVPVAG